MDPQLELVQAVLQDRKSERRFKYIRLAVIVGLAALYLGAGFVAMKRDGAEKARAASEPHIAVVDLKGTISASDSGMSEGLSLARVRKHLHDAFKDEQAKAVVLRINSPGGSPVQASLIHDEILELKKRHPGRKVIAVAEDYVASGGYFIAMAADELVVNRSTLAGSIGVISSGFGFTGLMDKLGIERRAFTAGTAKNGMDPFSPLTERDLAKYRELLSGIHGHFTDVVLTARKDRLKASPEDLFTGAAWTGEQAVKLGLADSLGSVTTVMGDLEATRIVVYGPSPSILEMLGGSIGTAASQQVLRATMQAPSAPLLQ